MKFSMIAAADGSTLINGLLGQLWIAAIVGTLIAAIIGIVKTRLRK